MFWKTLIAVLVTIAMAWMSHSAVATVATFVVAMLVVLVAEGVRIVPRRTRGWWSGSGSSRRCSSPA